MHKLDGSAGKITTKKGGNFLFDKAVKHEMIPAAVMQR